MHKSVNLPMECIYSHIHAWVNSFSVSVHHCALLLSSDLQLISPSLIQLRKAFFFFFFFQLGTYVCIFFPHHMLEV